MYFHAPTAPETSAKSNPPLDDARYADVAELRAAGHGWDAVAAVIGWDELALRALMRNNPRYEAAYATAERERDREADAEGLRRLRALVGDESPDIARRAAEIVFRYLSGKRRDETRLEVERLRAANRAKAAERPSAAEVRVRAEAGRVEAQNERLADALDEHRPVYMWGGMHALGDVAPDHTDTLLEMHPGRVGRAKFYWVKPADAPHAPTVAP